jgi:hypothetical protein
MSANAGVSVKSNARQKKWVVPIFLVAANAATTGGRCQGSGRGGAVRRPPRLWVGTHQQDGTAGAATNVPSPGTRAASLREATSGVLIPHP